MAIKASHHAVQRANERLNVTHKAKRNQLFSRALKYGHPPAHFTGEFVDYLENKKKKQKNVGVKVYDGNIYIYKNKLVITVFPVPNKYLPIQDNFANIIKSNPYLMKLYEVVDKEDILLEVLQRDSNSIVVGLFIDDVFQAFGVGKTELKAKNSAIRLYLNKINKLGDIKDSEGD